MTNFINFVIFCVLNNIYRIEVEKEKSSSKVYVEKEICYLYK